MVPTVQHDIKVQKGANFQLNIQARNPDGTVMSLVGYTGRFQVRARPDSVDPPLLSGTSADGRVTINGPAGIVSINVPADVTSAQTWISGVWACETLLNEQNVIRIAEGFASTSPEVVR
jgi:hypothetical protein